MTKQVQRRRGSSTQHTGFTGAEGEISVNTTNKSVHVHDGVTAGGFEAARADLNNVDSTANLSINNLTVTGDVSFGDNDKAIFGAGSDLQIYHNPATGSYIEDAGAGNLIIKGTSVVIDDSSGDRMASFIDNGAVTLNHGSDASARLATRATGVEITGILTSDGLTVGNNDLIKSDGSIIVDIDSDNNTTGAVFDIKANGNTKLVARFIENNDISFYEDTGTTAKFFWDASTERLGIGTSSPRTVLDIQNSALTAARISFADTDVIRNNYIGMGSDADELVISADEDAGGANSNIQFRVDGSEAMQIESNGTLLRGRTSRVISGTTYRGIVVEENTRLLGLNQTGGGTATMIGFHASGTQVGGITSSQSATTYATSSDYRLKTAVTYDWDATSRLKQLKPARFKWIVDGDDAVPVDGFLAHEVEDIVPESITGTKDAMRDEEYEVSAATGDIYTPAAEATYDDDGNEVTAATDEVIYSTDVEQPEELAEGQQWRETTAAVMGTRSVPDYQGIDQSKLTPLLTKALIEAVEKIEQLEARITALEAN